MNTSKSYDKIIKHDYYIGESASTSRKNSYDDNDDMSLNIIIPQYIVKKSMHDSRASIKFFTTNSLRAECHRTTKLGSNKYTVTVAELAELYKEHKASTPLTSSLQSSPSYRSTNLVINLRSPEKFDTNENNYDNIDSNTLIDCVPRDSMEDLLILTNQTRPVANLPSELVVKEAFSPPCQTRPVANLPSELVVKEAFSPPCQTRQVANLPSELVVNRLHGTCAPCQDVSMTTDKASSSEASISCKNVNSTTKGTTTTEILNYIMTYVPTMNGSHKRSVIISKDVKKKDNIEVSSYANVHRYKKLNFTFIEPIIERYRKRQIIPVN
jgi:hypothetical protein